MELSKEKGAYPAFKGSEWDTGKYFTRRGYTSENGSVLLPTSTSTVCAMGISLLWRQPVQRATLPIQRLASILFQEILHRGKQGSFTPKTAPDLNPKTFWLYKEAHTIDQQWSIRANAARQRHIDQAQSFNLYITPRMKASEILNLYIEAYKQGIKTIYYVRNQSLEMDECTSCSS